MTDENVIRPVPQWLERLSGWSWRLLAVAGAVVAVGLALAQVRIVFVSLVVALMLTTVLTPVRRRLMAWRVPRGFAAFLTLIGFLAVVVGFAIAIFTPVSDEFTDIGTTVELAIDDIEDWLVDGPFGVERSTIRDARDDLASSFETAISSDGVLVDGATVVAELFAGLVLTLALTFFLVKDADRLVRVALRALPPATAARAEVVGRVCWSTLAGYVRGAAMLGFIEALVIGGALWLVGADLVIPMAALTFAAAFFPFVGAIVAGILAFLVALTTSGVTGAIVVGIVALVVQQFDNELLAPFVYGRFLSVHPLLVLLGLATGAALGGLTGAFLAVPITAVAANLVIELRPGGGLAEVDDPDTVG